MMFREVEERKEWSEEEERGVESGEEWRRQEREKRGGEIDKMDKWSFGVAE